MSNQTLMYATKATKAVSVTVNCNLVSMYKIPGATCPTSSFECHKVIVQACPKLINDRMIVCVFGQSLPLSSKHSSRSTLVSQAFTHPCANWWRVAVAAHSSSRAEIDKKTDPTNALYNWTQ